MRLQPGVPAWVPLLLALSVAPVPGQAKAEAPAPPRRAGDFRLDLVDFRDVLLIDAMRLLSVRSGLNIVPSAPASQVPVSLYLRDVTPLTVVAAVAQANGLLYRREPSTGIVRIYSRVENQRDVTDFRVQQLGVVPLREPNVSTAGTAIGDLFGSRAQVFSGVSDRRTFDDLQDRFDRYDLMNGRSRGVRFPSDTGRIGRGPVRGVR